MPRAARSPSARRRARAPAAFAGAQTAGSVGPKSSKQRVPTAAARCEMPLSCPTETVRPFQHCGQLRQRQIDRATRIGASRPSLTQCIDADRVPPRRRRANLRRVRRIKHADARDRPVLERPVLARTSAARMDGEQGTLVAVRQKRLSKIARSRPAGMHAWPRGLRDKARGFATGGRVAGRHARSRRSLGTLGGCVSHPHGAGWSQSSSSGSNR